MGTISSSVGLISGLDIQSLVTQLMAIEFAAAAAPKRDSRGEDAADGVHGADALFLSAASSSPLTSPSFFRLKTAQARTRMS
jgi:hypothetical protein